METKCGRQIRRGCLALRPGTPSSRAEWVRRQALAVCSPPSDLPPPNKCREPGKENSSASKSASQGVFRKVDEPRFELRRFGPHASDFCRPARLPVRPWEIYRPSLRMCEAMTDTSGQPAMPSKVGVRKRGRTPPPLQEQAGPKVVVRERGRRQHSVEKPRRPLVALRERVKEVGPEKGGGPSETPRTDEHHSIAGAESPRLPQPTPGATSGRRIRFLLGLSVRVRTRRVRRSYLPSMICPTPVAIGALPNCLLRRAATRNVGRAPRPHPASVGTVASRLARRSHRRTIQVDECDIRFARSVKS